MKGERNMRVRAKLVSIPKERFPGTVAEDGPRCGIGQTFTCGPTVAF